MRIALGVSYNGQAYRGWQSQPTESTVQDKLEAAWAALLLKRRIYRHGTAKRHTEHMERLLPGARH